MYSFFITDIYYSAITEIHILNYSLLLTLSDRGCLLLNFSSRHRKSEKVIQLKLIVLCCRRINKITATKLYQFWWMKLILIHIIQKPQSCLVLLRRPFAWTKVTQRSTQGRSPKTNMIFLLFIDLGFVFSSVLVVKVQLIKQSHYNVSLLSVQVVILPWFCNYVISQFAINKVKGNWCFLTRFQPPLTRHWANESGLWLNNSFINCYHKQQLSIRLSLKLMKIKKPVEPARSKWR